jgi:uncharacterized protein YacL
MITLKDFINDYQSELVGTIICLAIFFFLRFLLIKTIRRIGRISDINQVRTILVGRYLTFALFIILLISLLFVWQVNFKELGLILSSFFAVLGVALFAIKNFLLFSACLFTIYKLLHINRSKVKSKKQIQRKYTKKRVCYISEII